ncbi:MAG: ATP-binding cassette domain-containing protein [Clostridiales bacterium]|nr:ATP-binding cassette domain-containing protein [Clostridiales bacterium]
MIEMIHVEKKYKKVVFSNINISLFEKGVYCLMGPSGSGKTTFLRLMMGLEQPDKGEVIQRANKISVVFQENRLLKQLTCLENIKVTGVTEERASEFLKFFGLEEAAGQYPEQLSGGMARRCALARAAAFDGDLFLLDEPFTGIDLCQKEKILYWLKKQSKEKLVVLATHDLWECAQISDEILFFNPQSFEQIQRISMKEKGSLEKRMDFLKSFFIQKEENI